MLRESGASSIPAAFVLEPTGRGVRDRPVKPGDDQGKEQHLARNRRQGPSMPSPKPKPTPKPKPRPARRARSAPPQKPYHHGDLRRVLIEAALQVAAEG